MTTEQYINDFERRITLLENPDVILAAATTTHQMQVARIFDQGEKASGNIGVYSTKPMYADQQQFANNAGFNPGGKPKQIISTKNKRMKVTSPTSPALFKNGNKRKSMYLQGGYRQLKSVQGLQSSFVNLSNTEALRNDFTQSLVSADNSFISGLSAAENVQKIAGLTEKYGEDLLALTSDERDFFKTAVKQAVTTTLQATP